ncbi:MAG: sensor domain-containing diguanylate cyclase [Desulfobacterales bacterium]|nr:sensor domain-containing diguanylate cyclase [Desulfobacterales bacterium]
MIQSLPPSLLDQLYDGVYFVDRSRRITYWNKAAERLTGYAAHEVIGKRCEEGVMVHVDGEGSQLCEKGCPLAATLEDGRVREADLFLRHKTGHRMPVALRVAPLRDEAGEIVGAVEIFNDSSGKIDLQQLARLEKEALLDPLTGLANRRSLQRHLEGRMEELRRYGLGFGVLFIDIDRFKQINDTHGHAVGDRVLQMIARTLSVNLRPFDEVGRWGGEEFVAVVANVDSHALSLVAERLRMLTEASGLDTETGRVRATVSIGAVLATAEESVEVILERADQLMYQSKIAGRNQISLGV